MNHPIVSKIVIDWSDLEASPSQDTNCYHHLLDWVRNYPDARDIRVILKRSAPIARFQRSLQALGCTVTACTAY